MRRCLKRCALLLLTVSAPLAAQQTARLRVSGNGWRVDIPSGLTLMSAAQLAALDRVTAERERKRGEPKPPSMVLFFAMGDGGGAPFINLSYIADSTATPTAFARTTPERAMALAQRECAQPRQSSLISCESGRIVQASGRAAHLSEFRRRVDGAEVLTWNLMVPSAGAYYKLTITMTEDQERGAPAEPIWQSFAIDD